MAIIKKNNNRLIAIFFTIVIFMSVINISCNSINFDYNDINNNRAKDYTMAQQAVNIIEEHGSNEDFLFQVNKLNYNKFFNNYHKYINSQISTNTDEYKFKSTSVIDYIFKVCNYSVFISLYNHKRDGDKLNCIS